MNIRYRFKHRKDGRIERSIFSLEQIENGDLFASWQMCDWQILSRDIGTGNYEKWKEVFENDLLIWNRTGTTFRVDWKKNMWSLTRVDGAYCYPFFDVVINDCEIIGRTEE